MAFLTHAQKLKDLFFKDTGKKPTTGNIENLSNIPTDDTIEGIFEEVRGYKEYVGSFIGEAGAITTDSQIDYRNEIDTVAPVFAFSSTGVYTLTFDTAGVLTASLTTVFTSLDAETHVVGAAVTDTEVITLSTGTIADGTLDDYIGTVVVYVRVYDA